MRHLPWLILVALCVWAAPAAAQDLTAYTGLSAGSHLTLGDWDLNDTGVAADAESGGAGTLHVGVVFQGLMPWGDLAVEADVGLLPMSSTTGVANVALFYGVDAMWLFLDGPYQPYVDLGIGFYTNLAGDLGADTDLAYEGGVGFRGELLSWLAARAELLWIVTDGWPVNSNLALSLGVDLLADI